MIIFVFNAHSDVTQLTNSGGSVIKNYEYDAFGVEIGKDDNDTNPFRYCGEYWDEETGTIYLRARYYEPKNGHFSAEDPKRDGLNYYTYAYSNPIMFVDPSGLVGRSIHNYFYQLGYGICLLNEDRYAVFANSSGASILWGSYTMSDKGLNYLANREVQYDAEYMNYDANGNLLSIDSHGADNGYGYDRNANGVAPQTLTSAQAISLLRTRTKDEANYIAKNVNRVFSQNQLDALIVLRYNIGNLSVIPGFVDLLESGNYNREEFRNMIIAYYESLIAGNPKLEENRNGWIARTDETLDIFFNNDYGKMGLDAVNGRKFN